MEWMHAGVLWDAEYEWRRRREGGGLWMRFAWSKISAEFWRIGRPWHDSPIRSIPIFKHFAPAVDPVGELQNLWNLPTVNPINPDGSILNACWPLFKVSSYSDNLTLHFLYLRWTPFSLDPIERWCFTMPSEKALTLPWNGLGGFLLGLLSAKLIMIKIRRPERLLRNVA